jgi:hypothetical protein
MKQKDVLIVAAAAGAVLVAMAAMRRGPFGGDAERKSGVRGIYGASAGQQAGVNAAVAQNWADLEQSVFKTQPDFWV